MIRLQMFAVKLRNEGQEGKESIKNRKKKKLKTKEQIWRKANLTAEKNICSE